MRRSTSSFSLLGIALLLFQSSSAIAADENNSLNEKDVIVLTDATFDEFLEKNPFVLVEFYAPWCGHCKQLAPEYADAATQLLDNEPPVVLAKMDATVETEVAKRFEISGYPTLKFFRNGSPEEYDGARDADGIVGFCKTRANPNYKPPPEAVFNLESQEQFDTFTKSGALTLVEFYAPWCGHCKKLAPEYEKAAKQLLAHDPPIKLAKMDATVHEEVAKKYDVSGFPAFKMFRAKAGEDGKMKVKSYPYDGPREEHGIVDYLIKQAGDAARPVNDLKELKANMLLDDVIVVGMFSSKKVPGYEIFQDSGSIVREKYTLLYTTNADIRQKYGVSDKEAVVVIQPQLMVTKHDKPYHVLEVDDDTQGTEILGFIDAYETPLIGTRTGTTKNRYSKRPLCVLFVPVNWSHDYREMTASWRDKLLPVANQFRKDFHFAMSDDENNDQDMKSFGFDDSGSDFSFGCYGTNGDKYPMEELDEWDHEEIEEFLTKVKKGKAKAYLRSQIPPKKQTKPVLTVTGKTFQQIVMDPTKDVLVELYAPWCGHCKQFEPEYKQLAKSLSSDKNLVIAKMNADANDGPDMYTVQGYPTIYFAPASHKTDPIKYEGKRDLADLKKFMKENAEVSFKNKKDEL